MANITAMDLMNNRGSQFAQLMEQGQQGQLRDLQMQQARQGMQDQERLRSSLPQLMQGGDPQGMLKSLMMSGNPQAMELAGKMSPIFTAMQKDTKTSWQDGGDKLIQIDAFGQPTGKTMAKGALPQQPEKLPWYVQKGAAGEPVAINPLYKDFETMKARAGAAGGQPYYQFLQTPEGYMAGNARTGGVAPVTVNGRPIMAAQSDPTLQGKIAGSKASGKEYGESGAKAAIALPQSLQEAENTIGLVDDLLKHPGFKQAVGGSSMLQIQRIPGTDAKDFMSRLDQMKGKQFLQAYETLKGGGQITEVEGTKATQAIARMDNTTSEAAFTQAAREYQNIIRQGVKRAKQKAAMGGGFQPEQPAAPSPQSPTQPTMTIPNSDAIAAEMKRRGL